MEFENIAYPAFIEREAGEYGVYFPTLCPKTGWKYPVSTGSSKQEAVKQAKKQLAYLLAAILYDNEELPTNSPIPADRVTKHMELISLKPTYTPYAEEIEEHLIWRHWHIDFNRDSRSKYKAVAYKNEDGLWDVKDDGIPIEGKRKKILQICPTFPLICRVQRRAEAEAAFDQFVRKLKAL